MQKQHALILGSTGHVGRALARVWPKDQPALWQYRPGAMPVADDAICWDILHTSAPDLPALSGVVQLARGPDTATDIALAEAACDLAARQGVPALIASSQAVYGPQPGKISEAAPCQPAGAYGAGKWAMEQAVQGRATCLRIGNVAGCDMLLMNAAKGRVTLDQLPDGSSPRRSYISAVGLGHVIRALLAQDARLPAVLNVAQPGTLAMADVLAAACQSWEWRDADPQVLGALELDVTRLMQLCPLPAAEAQVLIAEARAAGWHVA